MNKWLFNLIMLLGPSLVMGLTLALTGLTITGCTHVVTVKSNTQVEAEDHPFELEFGDIAHVASEHVVVSHKYAPNGQTYVALLKSEATTFLIKTKYLTQCLCGRSK